MGEAMLPNILVGTGWPRSKEDVYRADVGHPGLHPPLVQTLHLHAPSPTALCQPSFSNGTTSAWDDDETLLKHKQMHSLHKDRAGDHSHLENFACGGYCF